MTRHSIVLEPDGPGSYKFKFATGRGEISGHVRVGLEGPPDNRSEADQEQAALTRSWRSQESSPRPVATSGSREA